VVQGEVALEEEVDCSSCAKGFGLAPSCVSPAPDSNSITGLTHALPPRSSMTTKIENWGIEGKVLTDHKPPDGCLLPLWQIGVRLIEDHDGADYNGGAHGGEDSEEHRDGPLVCEVIGDLDFKGVVVVVGHHEGRAGRIEGQVEDCHDEGEGSID
jgi:hypothetical protein